MHIEEPPKLKLKVLPPPFYHVLLRASNTLPVIIAAYFLEWQAQAFVMVLKRFGYWMDDCQHCGNFSGYFTHKIQFSSDCKLSVGHQRRLNPLMQEVIKKQIIKRLDVGVIYTISGQSGLASFNAFQRKVV